MRRFVVNLETQIFFYRVGVKVLFLVQRLLQTFMDLRFNFAATKRRLAVVGLTSNIFVNKHSDFLALVF